MRTIQRAVTDGSGNYVLQCGPSEYAVRFSAWGIGYLDQYWNGKQSCETADLITDASSPVYGINATLVEAGT